MSRFSLLPRIPCLAVAVLVVACAEPEAPEGAAAGGSTEPTDAAELVERARAVMGDSIRVFDLVESSGDEVARSGRVTVYPSVGRPVVDLKWIEGAEVTRVHSDGEVVSVKGPSGAVRFSAWSEAGGTLFGEAAGKLLPAALDPSSFTSYGASLEQGPEEDTRRAVAGLPAGGGWQVAISTTSWLPRWVSFQAGAESPVERLELTPSADGEALAVSEFGLEPEAGEPATRYFAGPAPGEVAPDVDFELVDGTALRLSDLAGRVVVIDFWATWCAPCRPAMRKLEELYQEHREAGLEVYGLRLFDSGDASGYLSGLGISYPTGDGAPFAAPYAIETYGLPTLYVIGRDGRIARLIVGFSEANEKALVQAVESALGA